MRLLLLFVCTLLTALPAFASQPYYLLTEYLTDPLGIDSAKPAFLWRVNDSAQSAYQIQVTTDEKLFGKADMWDSGKVASNQVTVVHYAGKPLNSRTRYYWRVRTWDKSGKPGQYSHAAYFETALLKTNDWTAKWVTVPGSGGNGYHSQFGSDENDSKWVQIDLGKPTTFSKIVLYPARPYNFQRDEPGFGFPVRYKIEASNDPNFAAGNIIASIDRTDSDQPRPGANPVELSIKPTTARYLRITAAKLHHPEGTKPVFALAEVEILNSKGENLALRAGVKAKDSVEGYDWSTRLLIDGDQISRPPDRSSPIIRREFNVKGKISRARAYVTGLGYYELFINGQKIGDRVLDPARTEYSKRIDYSVYDITNNLTEGRNCAGIMLGNGWWNESPRFLLQMELIYANGSKQTIVSDDSWKYSYGPILENTLYHGETYDARRQLRGWDNPGFDDAQWSSVELVGMSDRTLTAQTIQPIQVVETIQPKKITSPKPGVYVVDFGQNFSGWCRISVGAPVGTKITLKHSELIYPDGTVNQENLRSARATDVYVTAGVGREVYEPRFTYHGFRYVQIEGWPTALTKDAIQGRLVCTALAPRGVFSCSNDLINKIQSCSYWGMRTNYHSIPTDCPQRDERQGWTGDAQMTASALYYNFDVAPACEKFLQDIADAQGEDGSVPDTVPKVWGGQNGDPMWSAAYPVILWETYLHTGDKGLLAKHYNGVKKLIEHLRSQTNDLILQHNRYGDWVSIEPTPKELISTGGFYWMTGMLADMAEALGKNEDAKTYRALKSSIAAAFNKAFYDPKTGIYGNGSQFSIAMPLALDIVPVQKRAQVLASLVDAVEVKHKGHLSTGFIGTPFLLDALVKHGRADLAYKIVSQPTYPGWGYMIENGATTVWELWHLATGNGMNSHNHPAFGFVSSWLYRNLAGLCPEAAGAGWSRFTVKPYVLGDLKWAKASINTLRGEVGSQWSLIADGIELKVTVPNGSVAEVYLPKLGKQDCRVFSGNAILGKGRIRDAGDWVSLDAGPGSHIFRLTGK